MKVLQVITSLGTGGAEKLLTDSILLYRARGIEVDLLLLNGTEFPLMERLKKENIKIICLSKGHIRTVYNPFLIFKIIPQLKRYDVVHVHLFPTLYWVAFAKIFSGSKTKLIYTEHSTQNRRMNSRYWSPLERFIYNKYSKIIAISEEIRIILKNYLPLIDSKLRVINNGVDISMVENATAKVSPSEKNDKKIVIQVSSFKKPKDQITVIRSLPLLSPNVHLWLVGDGIDKHLSEKLAKDLEVSDRVTFLGIRMDVPRLLKSADIIVLSSHHEGMSLSSIEGLASGRPFIASDVPGLRPIVEGAGLLFPDNEERVLAKHITDLLSNEIYYGEVATRCVERARAYDINIMVDKYIETYKQLI